MIHEHFCSNRRSTAMTCLRPAGSRQSSAISRRTVMKNWVESFHWTEPPATFSASDGTPCHHLDCCYTNDSGPRPMCRGNLCHHRLLQHTEKSANHEKGSERHRRADFLGRWGQKEL